MSRDAGECLNSPLWFRFSNFFRSLAISIRFWQCLPISLISVNQWFLARRLEELGVVAFARAENSAIILRRLCGEYLAVCSENFSVRTCAADWAGSRRPVLGMRKARPGIAGTGAPFFRQAAGRIEIIHFCCRFFRWATTLAETGDTLNVAQIFGFLGGSPGLYGRGECVW